MFIDKEKKEIICKVIYWGYQLAGKRTNIEYIYHSMTEESKGELVRYSEENKGNALECDVLIPTIKIKGLALRSYLYTVPGQVISYDFLRKGLKGVDGIVFVAYPSLEICDTCKENHNKQQIDLLRKLLEEQNYDINKIPMVVQFNRRDYFCADPIGLMRKQLGFEDKYFFEAVASKGIGVFETFKLIIKLILLENKEFIWSSIHHS